MRVRRIVAGLCLGAAACNSAATPGHSIAVMKFATLGATDGPGAMAQIPNVSERLPGNRWAVWGFGDNGGAPALFDSTGAYLGPLGRIGDGPGEFRRIGTIDRGPGDSIVVFSAGRVTLLDRNLHPGRSFPDAAGYVQGAVALPDGWFLFPAPGSPGRRESAVAEANGSRKFGIPAQDTAIMSIRGGSAGAGSTIWVIERMHRLILEQWDTLGHRLRRLELSRDWFPPYVGYESPEPDRPPTPTVAGFWVDSLDRLWLAAWVADPKWADAKGSYHSGEGGSKYWVPDDPAAVRDEIVEVTDLKTGKVVAFQRFDQPIGWVVEPGVVAQTRQDSDGWWFVDLSRVELR